MVKKLSERRDYYSLKRMASKKIIEWTDKGISKEAIIRILVLEYGFGEEFYKKTLKTFGLVKND